MSCRLPVHAAAVLLLAISNAAFGHQGPDPVAHWAFGARSVTGSICKARLGPDLYLPRAARLVSGDDGPSIDLTGEGRESIRSAPLPAEADSAPRGVFTVSAWVLIDEAESRGGIVSLAPVGDGVPLWTLGYDSERFTLSVDRGESAVAVRGASPYPKGEWRHVVGVFDGRRAELYVNGQLDGETTAADQAANNAAPTSVSSRYFLGATGRAGDTALRGRLRDVSVYDLAAKPAWVRHAFEDGRHLVALRRDSRADELAMVVEPYLQHGTQDGMTVMWQTTLAGSSTVRFGETAECDQTASGADGVIHEVRIEGLEPQTQYFYRVETTDDAGQSAGSGVSTFSTAVLPGTPFAFAVISDTQGNPVVSGKLARHAWAQRPSFLLHPGDLVSTGVNDTHWTQHFFPGMRELISRVPLFPVLGNHEQNASNYYEYMSLPDPEYYYDFAYGDAHFFMIDTNRNVGPGSEQYEWLDGALGASEAKWKFACHHHPPYSSDENDYGDLWQTNKSSRGDLRARQLSALYDKHGVDLVWTGHIHSYERTWPVRDGRAVSGDGPVYMIVGGGGGGLETPGPFRPFFQNQVRRGHHYVMAHLNGSVLELRSYDLDDRLFDTVTIRKPASDR